MARSFEAFDSVRLKRSLFNLPKHTIGQVIEANPREVHVMFAGLGAAILSHLDVELLPTVVDDVPGQLSLFQNDDLVRATRIEDKIIITPFIGTSNDVFPDDPESEVIATRFQIWSAYLHSTDFEEFMFNARFRTYKPVTCG